MNLNFLLQTIAVLLSLAGVSVFKYLYATTNNLGFSILFTIIYEIVVLVFGFFNKVWRHLIEIWSKQIADWLDLTIRSVLSGYRREYDKHVIYQNRVYDVKGQDDNNPYSLELEKVFVQLSVIPTPPKEVSKNPIEYLPESLQGENHNIWDFLNARNAVLKYYAILGPPGSGKTTLLKYIALCLTAPRRQRKKMGAPNLIPIILYMRELSESIQENPNTPLPELICRSLTIHKAPLPPTYWLERQLQENRCLVMIDGMDEIANSENRKLVASWIENCIIAHGQNIFLITSRPHGYTDNPIAGVTVLQVRPFNFEQIEKFVKNWYLANEIMSAQKDDLGVRILAEDGANELLSRLKANQTLMELAVNPLLLKMISTVHRYKGSLPGRRVDLYAAICDVFLGKLKAALGIKDALAPDQKIRILRVLAYFMMDCEILVIPKEEAAKVISTTLAAVSPGTNPADFLKTVEDKSGILIEHENGVYSFSHKTFQEYLAAEYVLALQLEDMLISHVSSTWWRETLSLYAARANASRIIDACLGADTETAFGLAISCMEDGCEVEPVTRQKYNIVFEQGAEDRNPERRRLIARAILNNRIR